LKLNEDSIKTIRNNFQKLSLLEIDSNTPDNWSDFRLGYIAGSIVSMLTKSKFKFGCESEEDNSLKNLLFSQLKQKKKNVIFSETHIEVVTSFLDFCKKIVFQILGDDAKLLQDCWIASENALNDLKKILMNDIENQKLWNNIELGLDSITQKISALMFQFIIDKICILIFVDTIRKIDNHNILMKKK